MDDAGGTGVGGGRGAPSSSEGRTGADALGPSGESRYEQLGDRLRRWGIVAWSTIGIILLGAAFLWALMQIQVVLPPLVLALVTIFVLNPFVSRLERLGLNRILGSCLGYVVFFAFLTVVLLFLIPVLVEQGQAFIRDFPRTVDRLADLGGEVSGWAEKQFGVGVDLEAWLGTNQAILRDALGTVGGILRTTAEIVVLVVIGLVVGFYLLIDLPRLRRSLLRLAPPHRRDEVLEVAGKVARAMGGFFRGQLLVALLVGVLSALALRLVGLPYWLVVGMIAGFFNLIPMVGPYIGGIPAVLIAGAFLTPWHILYVVIALAAVQQIDNHFISPNVMRWAVRLHPVTVMLSLLAGAALAGFSGMLLAVPLVASIKVVAAHFWRTRIPWGAEVFDEDEVRGDSSADRPDAVAPDVDGREAAPLEGAEGPRAGALGGESASDR